MKEIDKSTIQGEDEVNLADTSRARPPGSGSLGIGPSLTKSAGLTFASQILLTVTRAATSFILTPVMLARVGAELFGAWGMLQQLVSYLALGDLRPAGTLKYLLANRQSSTSDTAEKQRLIATAVSYSVCSLPIFVLLGFFATHYLADLVSVGPEHFSEVRTTFIVLLVGFFIDRVLSIPSNILAAHNMGYAGTINSLLWVLSGLIGSVIVLEQGLGLVALALVTVSAWAGRSVAQFVICIRALPWVALAKPLPGDHVAFVRISGWLSLSAISGFFLGFADILIIGFLLGPRIAAVYGIASLTSRAVFQLVSSLLGSGNAGMLKLLSNRDYVRVSNARNELHAGALLLLCLVGPVIIALNDALIGAWLGAEHRAGVITALGCVTLIALQLWARVDSVLLDGFGAIRLKALSQTGCAILLALVAPIAAIRFGLNGVILSICLANFLFGWIVKLKVSENLSASHDTEQVKDDVIGPVILLVTFLSAALLTNSGVGHSITLLNILVSIALASGATLFSWRLALVDSGRAALRSRVYRLLRRQW